MTAYRLARHAAPLAIVIGLIAAVGPAQAQARRDSLTLYELPDYRGGSVTFYGDNANIGSTGFANRAQSAQVIGSWRLCAGGGFRNRCETVSSNIRDLDTYGLSRQVGSAQRIAGAAYDAPPAARYDEPPASRYEAPQAYPLAPAQSRPVPSAARPYGPPAEPYAADGYLDAPYAAPALPAAPYDPRYGDTRPGYDNAPSYDDRPGADPYYGYAPPVADAPYEAGQAPGADGIEGRTVVFFPQPTMDGRAVSAQRQGAADAFCRRQGLGPAVYFDQSQRAARSIGADGRGAGAGPILADVVCRR